MNKNKTEIKTLHHHPEPCVPTVRSRDSCDAAILGRFVNTYIDDIRDLLIFSLPACQLCLPVTHPPTPASVVRQDRKFCLPSVHRLLPGLRYRAREGVDGIEGGHCCFQSPRPSGACRSSLGLPTFTAGSSGVSTLSRHPSRPYGVSLGVTQPSPTFEALMCLFTTAPNPEAPRPD